MLFNHLFPSIYARDSTKSSLAQEQSHFCLTDTPVTWKVGLGIIHVWKWVHRQFQLFFYQYLKFVFNCQAVHYSPSLHHLFMCSHTTVTYWLCKESGSDSQLFYMSWRRSLLFHENHLAVQFLQVCIGRYSQWYARNFSILSVLTPLIPHLVVTWLIYCMALAVSVWKP